MVATTTAATTLGARTLCRDERPYLLDAAGIEDVVRLDPAAPRRADAETHLSSQSIGPVTVAVDRDRHPRLGGPARQRTVHVEMSRRSIDLHGRARLDCRVEECVEVDVVAG